MTLEADLRELVREEVQAAVVDALDGMDLEPGADAPEQELRSVLWRMEPETRIPLSDIAEILDVSERSVRRYASRESTTPRLPLRDGPTGKVTTAGELCDWIQDAERAEQFRQTAGGGA